MCNAPSFRVTAAMMTLGATGLASAQGDGDTAAGYRNGAIITSEDGNFSLRANAEFQFRYQATFGSDTDSDHDAAMGFQYNRTRLKASGHMLDPKLTYQVLAEFNRASGDSNLSDAFGEYKAKPNLRLRFGQFKPAFDREFSTTSPTLVLLSERSIPNAIFRVGRAQGVQARLDGDRWRLYAGLNDGRFSLNTGYTSPIEAEYAVSSRAEFRLGDASWDQWRDQTAFRGDEFGALLGAGVHWQREGLTGSPDGDGYLAFTADLGVEGSGWNVLAALYGHQIDTGDSDDFTDLGAVLQGGLFLSERLEAFTRFAEVFPDDDRAESDSFTRISGGLNWYAIPESHAVKVTAEVAHSLDAQADSAPPVAAPSQAHALLPDTEDGQTALIFQVQLVF